MNALHYSSAALVRRCGGMVLMTLLVGGDYAFGAHRTLHLMRIAPVLAPVVAAVALYLVGATVVMTLMLARHGAVALSWDDAGIACHTAWNRRRFAWAELSQVALDVRHTRGAHWFVVALRRSHGWQNGFAIDARLLAETFDRVGDWTDAAEQQRLAQGGVPYAAPTGLLSGWVASSHAQEVAAARAAGRV